MCDKKWISLSEVTWMPPVFEEEAHEFDRYFACREEARRHFSTGRIMDELLPGKPVRNFDGAVVDLYHRKLVDLDQLVGYYTARKRRCRMILDAYRKGGTLTAIVLFDVDGRYYEVVSGNTRLVFSRVLQVAPVFWVIDVLIPTAGSRPGWPWRP